VAVNQLVKNVGAHSLCFLEDRLVVLAKKRSGSIDGAEDRLSITSKQSVSMGSEVGGEARCVGRDYDDETRASSAPFRSRHLDHFSSLFRLSCT
jgi:hypothetical protein